MVICLKTIITGGLIFMATDTAESEQLVDNKTKSKKRYANSGSMHVAAALNDLYRFRTESSAAQALEKVKRQFTVSTREELAEEGSIVLWIRDYEVSDEETEKGFLGHFARLKITEREDGLYTITASKLPVEMKYHPLRKRPTARCPNWGHPILRGIKKGKQYPTIEAANGELEALHLEYPDTTVPSTNKLYLMIFSRQETPEKPISRYVLEIKNLQGGGFTIEWSKNTFKRKEPSVPAEAKTEEAKAQMGHFASMVAIKRKPKK